ncbi:uncharacterized protein LOC125224917 [Leguminivora glycinivorella]|uniref:uncharacterized protein LOC125224917 n=1 Tax=Leguminivora glycinivorella TaxID=1035111 RepID=UPI002010374B|nr:uncharacterized protein LOC125224917 [Leguminivora glycinivorella]
MIIGFAVSGVLLLIIIIQSITLCIVNCTCKSRGARNNVDKPDISESRTNREEITENQGTERSPDIVYQNQNELQATSRIPSRINIPDRYSSHSVDSEWTYEPIGGVYEQL